MYDFIRASMCFSSYSSDCREMRSFSGSINKTERVYTLIENCTLEINWYENHEFDVYNRDHSIPSLETEDVSSVSS